jgi:type I restriction enzyme, S subunit
MRVKPGYKHTQVGVIPDDWNVSSLDTVCSMKSGEGITAAQIDTSSPYPCYGGNGTRGYTSRFTHDGDFALIGRQGALCGNVVAASGKFFASEHAVVVTPRAGTDIRFLTYVLGEMRLNRFSESSAQPGLSVAKIQRLMVATPRTETEQRAIAAALGDVDALLAGLSRLIAKKRDLKLAAMQQLLTGKTRLPGFEEEWEVRRLGELGVWRGGMTPSMSNPLYWEGGDVPWISSGDVKVSRLRDTSQHVTAFAVRCGAAIVVPDNSIVVVTRSGILRRCLPIALVVGSMAINQDIKALIPHAGVSADYLLHALTGYGKEILTSCLKAGTTVESIEFPWLKAFEIPVPPSDEQAAITAVLSDMDAELVALEARREKTHALKLAMMQELLTGKTRLV